MIRRRLVLSAMTLGSLALLPPAGVARAQPAPPGPVKILFCGDSLAQGMFLSLNGVLRRRAGLRAVNGTLHATGVTRSDEHDWPTAARDLVARNHPDLVIFWIGANDFRPLVVREQRIRFAFGTQGFAEGYARRVTEMVTPALASGAKVVWFGLPNMRGAQIAEAARQLNEIQQNAVVSAGGVFIPTWDATSDAEGRFLPSVPLDRGARVFRAEDGVHFTDWGYRRIAALFFDDVDHYFPEMAQSLGRLGDG
ncbi:GDSL-type esterase/lipase family protein [Roseococcus sp.]|uniref:SGNH/GDSL hydrolase family protein n=1 Tax=Roseococcus sp. TaxID=2109646 RepID=UPI003BAAD7E1